MSGREKYSDNMRPLSVKKASKGGNGRRKLLEKYKTPSTKAEKVITKLNLG